MTFPLIDIRQLRYVVMLVKHRNFRRAADALFITQPALTKSIRNLEELLGVTLFDREPNDVNPTAYCDVLMEHATQVFVELDEIYHKLDLMAKLQRGELKLGCGPIVAQTLVPDVVSALVGEHPELNICITVDSWHVLTRLLRQGDIHLFIADIEELMDQPDLIIEKLPTGKNIFVCRPQHPHAPVGILTPEDLLEYPLVLTSLPRRYVRWFMENAPEGMAPEAYYKSILRIRCENFEVLRNITRRTNYITCGPEILFREDMDSGRLVKLDFEGFSTLNTSVGVVYLKNRTLPPSGRALIECLSVLVQTQSDTSVYKEESYPF